MNILAQILLFAGFSGATVFIGGLLARYFNHHVEDSPVKYEITHTAVAFGGGIILSALVLVLVPKGMELLGHNSSKTTEIYTQVTTKVRAKFCSFGS